MISTIFHRWIRDLKLLVENIGRDPLAQNRGRRWESDFSGSVNPRDHQYAAFIVIGSFLPAALVAAVSTEPQWRVMAQFFGVPLQAVITGFLSASLIFLGSHLNQVQKPFTVAYKLMLRTMAIYPVLVLLSFFRFGPALAVLIYGFFVLRGVRKTYVIPLYNTLLFFGITYLMFAVLQLNASLHPTTPPSHLVPENGTRRTSSSSSMPN